MEFTCTLNAQGIGQINTPPIKLKCEHLAGKKVRVKITEQRKRMTNSMYGYYHGVIKPLIHAEFVRLGNDVSEDLVHEFLKQQCPHVKRSLIDTNTGETREYTPHLDQITKEEGLLFMDWCIRFAAETMSIVIPPPNTQTDLQL